MLVVHMFFFFLRHCICCVQVCWLDIFSFLLRQQHLLPASSRKCYSWWPVKCSCHLIQTCWPVVKFTCASTCPYWVKHVFLLPFSSPVVQYSHFLSPTSLSLLSHCGDPTTGVFLTHLVGDFRFCWQQTLNMLCHLHFCFLLLFCQADWYAVSLKYVDLRALRVRLGASEMFIIIIVLISGGCWGHLSAIGKGFAKTTAGAIS